MDDTNSLKQDKSFEERTRELSIAAETSSKEIAHSSDENRASRLFIMRYVVTLYVTVVGSLFIANIAGAFLTSDWPSTSKNLFELVSTLVLPIVTLVLGYYFGREGREQDKR